ncbi:MAG: ABC transporter substrate-binding protein [Promethearchaeota archaeon]|nr:MAG: ABC transporter substrate-binding protein [Candidatus Lokiarchaeota archaeon]
MICIRKEDLNIGHLSTVYHTNFILMENNEFKKNFNRNINWILFGTGPEMVRAFRNKKLDIGYMGLPPAIIGIDNGVSIKCVAGGHVEGTIMIAKNEYENLNGLNGSIYDTLAQFRGKSIGVTSKGSIHDVILNYYLKKYGLHNQIDVKNYIQAEFIALDLKQRNIEAGVGTPALAVFASSMLNSHIIIPPEFMWLNNPSYGIFFHENIIENYPDLVFKFLSYHKGVSYMLRSDPSKAAEIICKNVNVLKVDYVKAILEISPKYCIALSEGYIHSTMKFVKSLFNLGYIKKILLMKDIFDFQFVEKIHPEKQHYIE